MRHLIIAILALAATACSEGDRPEPDPQASSQVQIRVAGNAAVVAETRAPYTGTISNTNPFTARVLTSRYADNYSPMVEIAHGDGPMTFRGQDTSYTLEGAQQYAVPYDGEPAYYPANANTNVYITGVYPAGGWTLTGNVTLAHTFNGTCDLMTAPQISTNKGDATASPTTFRNLAFSHRMTLLEVQVTATGGQAITNWGALQSLLLTGVNGVTPTSVMTVNLTNNTTSFSGSSTLPFYITGGDVQYAGQNHALTTTPQTVAYCIAPPVTIDNAGDVGYTILAKTTLNTGGVNVPIAISTAGSTEGKRILVTITFSASQAVAPPRIATPWENYDRL